jgi:hypothetical protein
MVSTSPYASYAHRPIKYWACSSNNASLCYAATTAGLDRTTDKGTTWVKVPGALLAGDARGTFVDGSTRPPTVWHATSSGIYRWRDGTPGGAAQVRAVTWLLTQHTVRAGWWRRFPCCMRCDRPRVAHAHSRLPQYASKYWHPPVSMPKRPAGQVTPGQCLCLYVAVCMSTHDHWICCTADAVAPRQRDLVCCGPGLFWLDAGIRGRQCQLLCSAHGQRQLDQRAAAQRHLVVMRLRVAEHQQRKQLGGWRQLDSLEGELVRPCTASCSAAPAA